MDWPWVARVVIAVQARWAIAKTASATSPNSAFGLRNPVAPPLARLSLAPPLFLPPHISAPRVPPGGSDQIFSAPSFEVQAPQHSDAHIIPQAINLFAHVAIPQISLILTLPSLHRS